MVNFGYGTNHCANLLSTEPEMYARMRREGEPVAWAILAVALVGLAVNTLSIVVFCRLACARRSTGGGFFKNANTVTITVTALSAYDLILLPGAVVAFGLPAVPIADQLMPAIERFMPVYMPLAYTAEMCSDFTLVLVSFERWLVVCRPIKAELWWNKWHTLLTLAIIIVASIVCQAIILSCVCYSCLEHMSSSNPCYILQHNFNGLVLVPFKGVKDLLILAFNGHTMCALLRSVKLGKACSNKKNFADERRLTIMCTVLTVTTMFFTVKHSVSVLLAQLLRMSIGLVHAAYLDTLIHTLLYVTNESFNDLLYYVFMPSYRRALAGHLAA